MTILRPGYTLPPSNAYPIYARSGWAIPVETALVDDPQLMQIRNQELMKWKPRITLRSPSPHFYNCVGLIFASRRAWIEIDHIYDLFREDQYRQIASNDIMVGDVVLYKYQNTPSHVAMIVDIDRSIGRNIRVVSKWGKHAEFIHFIEDVLDNLGTPSEYWTDRP